MNAWKKRLLAVLLALCMTGGSTLPAYAVAEPDLALEDAFGTSDCEVIAQEAVEDLSEEEADTAAEEAAAAEAEEKATAQEPAAEKETPEEETAAPAEQDSTIEEIVPAEGSGEAESAALELRWKQGDDYVASADIGYVYTGEIIAPEYQLWDTETKQAVEGDWAEVYCLDEKGDETAQEADRINCGRVYLFLYEKDEQGKPTGDPVASGSFCITPAEQTIAGVKDSYSQSCSTTLALKPTAQGTISYVSSDSAVVAVDQKGVLSFLSGGTATITITAAATENYQQAVKTVKVTAKKRNDTITASANSYTVKYGKNKTFKLNAKAESGTALTYKSSDTRVVKVNSVGTCTLVGMGKATITVSSKGNGAYNKGQQEISVVSYHTARSLSYSKSYKSGKYYKALMALKLTGGKRADTVAIALSQLGYHEGKSRSKLSGKASGSGNNTEYGRYYGLTCGAWCAMFVSWCAREAGVSTGVIPKYCAVRSYYSYYHRSGRKFYSWKKIRSGSYKPKKGDLIMYANVKGGVAHHIGYVISSSYSGKKLTLVTVEGNTKDQVRKVTMKLTKSGSGKINGHYILGVAHPNY